MFLFCSPRFRSELAEVSYQHQEGMKQVHTEIAEVKSLLLQVLQISAPSGTRLTLPPLQVLQAPTPEPSERRSSKKSPSGRSRKRHRQEPGSRSQDEKQVPYQGLPLVQDTSNSVLPSVSALTARVVPRPQRDPPA